MTVAEHYFTPRPDAPTRPREVTDTLRGIRFTFATDAAVFSRGKVDKGTRLLIDQLPVPVVGKALDLGCGYGPIGLTVAACSPDAHVLLVDINERAVSLAARNAKRNGITNVTVRAGDGFAAAGDDRFALIASNPPIRAGKRVIYPWVEQAYEHLLPGGLLMVVARTNQGAQSLARKVQDVFGHCEEAAKGAGYRVLTASKPV